MAVKSGFGANLDGLERLKKQLQNMDKRISQELTLTAGWDENCRYPGGEYAADVAVIQEYGAILPAPPDMKGKSTVRIPPRPFIRPCIAKNEGKWEYIVAQGLKQALTDESLTGEKILLRASLTMVTDLKASINAVDSPPLSDYTIRKRHEKNRYSPEALALGYDRKPLQDTGYLLRSITYFVRPGIPGKHN